MLRTCIKEGEKVPEEWWQMFKPI